MKVEKYYCDCCGKKVKSEEDLNGWDVYSSFKDMQDNPNPYDYREICSSCNDRIDMAIVKEFDKIRKENKKDK